MLKPQKMQAHSRKCFKFYYNYALYASDNVVAKIRILEQILMVISCFPTRNTTSASLFTCCHRPRSSDPRWPPSLHTSANVGKRRWPISSFYIYGITHLHLDTRVSAPEFNQPTNHVCVTRAVIGQSTSEALITTNNCPGNLLLWATLAQVRI